MTLFENAYNDVAALVRKFEEHKDQFLSPKYQEAEVRAEFLDNFFIALGWDVRHIEQTNPREQEVKIEKSDSVSFRKADYAFYLKPEYQRPVFLVEAKKPWEDLSKPEYYFQTARYGFNTATSVAVLTDFQEFHIIDCRRKPELVAGIVQATRLFKFTYQQYLDRDVFGEIYWKFSHEAVAAGKLKEYWKSLKKPKGAAKQLKLVGDQLQAPDDLFLEDLDKYRKELASTFKSANKELTSQDLTEAAQKVLDRLVFIRFLQDKAIEADFIIEKFTSDAKTSSWKSFIVQSQKLDKTYNGVVFKEHFIDRPSFTPPKDDRFSLITDEFSHKRSPYLFSYIPVEILGSIYERFLGKVVVPKGSGIAVEEKPEVRKAGGVYYTPKYIVDYIVANTVGKILNEKNPLLSKEGAGGGRGGTAISSSSDDHQPPPNPRLGKAGEQEGLTPKEISMLRFADIACGSGSFLIAVFDTIINYLEQWYTAHPGDAAKDGCREMESDDNGRMQYGLSLEQKRAILQNNIFGVDIDSQAVEVAQFSLFLKLLESETIATVQLFSTSAERSKKVAKGQLTFHHGVDRKILPDLSKNIQCGNSLVEYDISDLFPLTTEEEMKIKPFSFNQAFRPIMDAGGFDAIVGNPPYRMLQPHNTSENMLTYLRSRFFAADFKVDFFHLFLQRATLLLKSKGKLGYIIPSSILNNVYVEKLRKWLIVHSRLDIIAVHREAVFAGADVHTAVLILNRENEGEAIGENLIRVAIGGNDEFQLHSEVYETVAQHRFGEFSGTVWNVLLNEKNARLIKKTEENSTRLGNKGKINRGLITGDRAKYFSEEKKNDKFVPILAGTDVNRYYIHPATEYVLFQRPKTSGGCWDPDVHFAPHKLLVRQIGIRPTATLITQPIAVTGNIFTVMAEDVDEEKYILAILNSNLIRYYWQTMFADFKASFPQVTIFSLAQVPIQNISDDDNENVNRRKLLISLVNQILVIKKQLAASQRDSEKEQLQRKCDYIDGEIDRLVYELYGLTAEEIKIVEGV